MSDVGYAAALLLAAVFAWSGVAKLGSRATTVRTFRAFDLAAPEALATGVPLVEIALAVGLVLVPAEAALGAMAVLAGFTTLLVRALRAGVDIGCGCFGTARRTPVSFVEIVRNGLLASAALVASAAAGPVRPDLEAVLTVGTAALIGAVVLALCDLKRVTGRLWSVDLRTAEMHR